MKQKFKTVELRAELQRDQLDRVQDTCRLIEYHMRAASALFQALPDELNIGVDIVGETSGEGE